MIQVNPKATPKAWWKSKAIWAAAASMLLGAYEVVQSYRPELPRISDALYLFLYGFGVYGLRMARRPIDVASPAPLPPQPAALPDASLTSYVEPGEYAQHRYYPDAAEPAPLDTGPGPGPR